MNYFRKLSVKYKIISIIFFVVIIALVIEESIDFIYKHNSLRESYINQANFNAQFVSEYCLAPLSSKNKEEAESILSKLSTIPYILNAILYDENEELLANYDKENPIITPAIPKNGDEFIFDKNLLHVFKTIETNKRTIGTIYFRISTKSTFIEVKNHLILFLLISILLSLVVYYLASKLQKYISQP
ncbi:MAG: CHASE sensor domain-containing protein, partial [Candidatus Cloacimonadota bacterium]|nr:CHASE sensor domain-containing protein [Candidatus Cloacimonadota bacterium]